MSAEAPSIINLEVNYKFSGRGEIYSHTTIYENQYAPTRFKEQVPYTTAIVELEEGPRVTAQLTDPDPDQPFEIGMPVEMVTRKLFSEGKRGQLVYGYKFRPLLESSVQSE